MNAKLPNLELLEFKANMYLNTTDVYKEKKAEHINPTCRQHAVFDIEMFPQVWGNTCGPFDIDKNEQPVISGCAMTKMYTTVFHETSVDMFVVFFGESLGYIIHDAKPEFLEDLKKHNLASLGACLKTKRY